MEFEILNNSKRFLSSDVSELVNVLYEFPKQFKKAEQIIRGTQLNLKKNYSNILILGNGNPAHTAYRLLKASSENRLKVPVEICSSKMIPSWVNSKTLVIAVTHSGKTIDVINAVDEILKMDIEVIIITTGGKIREKFASSQKVQFILYAEKLLPRLAVGYAYVLLIGILSRANLITVSGIKRNGPLGLIWDDIENELFQFTRELMPEIKIENNIAKKLAINLYDTIPVLYGCNKITEAISYRFKIELNATSKMFAHFNMIPEIEHDEIVAWEMNPQLRKKFFILFIIDDNADKEILERINILKNIFLERAVSYDEIHITGQNETVKAFRGIFISIWTSIYLAILNNVNPVEINLVDDIKKRIGSININI